MKKEWLVDIECIRSARGDEEVDRHISRARTEGGFYVFDIAFPARLQMWKQCSQERIVATQEVLPMDHPPIIPDGKKHKGLGDTIEALIKAGHLDKLADMYERISGKDCGCKARKEWLNRLLPYKRSSPA